jgi:hypothetical protein
MGVAHKDNIDARLVEQALHVPVHAIALTLMRLASVVPRHMNQRHQPQCSLAVHHRQVPPEPSVLL